MTTPNATCRTADGGPSPPNAVTSPTDLTPHKQPTSPADALSIEDSKEAWCTNSSFISYYRDSSQAQDSQVAPPLPSSSQDDGATTVGLPSTRGVVVMFAEVFDDNAVCEIFLSLLHQPEFGAAVAKAYLDVLRTRGAPAAVLKRADELSRRVLRDGCDFEELQLLLLAPRRGSKPEQLAWCARSPHCPCDDCADRAPTPRDVLPAGTTASSSTRATCGWLCSCSS